MVAISVNSVTKPVDKFVVSLKPSVVLVTSLTVPVKSVTVNAYVVSGKLVEVPVIVIGSVNSVTVPVTKSVVSGKLAAVPVTVDEPVTELVVLGKLAVVPVTGNEPVTVLANKSVVSSNASVVPVIPVTLNKSVVSSKLFDVLVTSGTVPVVPVTKFVDPVIGSSVSVISVEFEKVLVNKSGVPLKETVVLIARE